MTNTRRFNSVSGKYEVFKTLIKNINKRHYGNKSYGKSIIYLCCESPSCIMFRWWGAPFHLVYFCFQAGENFRLIAETDFLTQNSNTFVNAYLSGTTTTHQCAQGIFRNCHNAPPMQIQDITHKFCDPTVNVCGCSLSHFTRGDFHNATEYWTSTLVTRLPVVHVIRSTNRVYM